MPDGKSFVSDGHGKKIYEWNAETGERIGIYNATTNFNDAAFLVMDID